jgi:DNA-binding NarL/FixJ family response regulator
MRHCDVVSNGSAPPAREVLRQDMVRMLIVDDHAAYRSAVAQWFSIHESVSAITEADSVDAALVALRRASFDLVVMDVHMPGTNGIDGALALRSEFPALRIALCSTSDASELPELARITSAAGHITFFPKGDLEPDALISWFRGASPTNVVDR